MALPRACTNDPVNPMNSKKPLEKWTYPEITVRYRSPYFQHIYLPEAILPDITATRAEVLDADAFWSI